MGNKDDEIKKGSRKPWHKKAWVFIVTITTGLGVVIALINGWFTIVKNIKGDKPAKDSVKIITVPVQQIDSTKVLDSCALARKELNETGVNWSIKSFVDALVDGDKKNIELFLKGCMPVYSEKDETSIILFGLQPGLRDREWKLRLFIASGFDINRNLSDNKIMKSRYESLPPNYNTALTPSGYESSSHSFKGPLGLWLVTCMAYAGVKDDDEALIKTLADNGDKFEIEKDFLRFMESSWGNTESYKQTEALLIKYSK